MLNFTYLMQIKYTLRYHFFTKELLLNHKEKDQHHYKT